MKDKTLILTSLLIVALILPMSITPSLAFVYPDGSQDNNFDAFGPHIDRLLIRKYSGSDAEMTALQAGEIDIADWPLTQPWLATLAADPNIRVSDCDGNTGYFTFSFNLNNNPYLGNPLDPAYLNPENPNPKATRTQPQTYISGKLCPTLSTASTWQQDPERAFLSRFMRRCPLT